MKITKDNLTIRSAVPDDAEILTSWWNDGKVMAHAGFPLGLNQTLEQTLAQIKENETSIPSVASSKSAAPASGK
jgi:hypothetical protein